MFCWDGRGISAREIGNKFILNVCSVLSISVLKQQPLQHDIEDESTVLVGASSMYQSWSAPVKTNPL